MSLSDHLQPLCAVIHRTVVYNIVQLLILHIQQNHLLIEFKKKHITCKLNNCQSGRNVDL